MTIPKEICSKCHENFMNCKCDQFHPNFPGISGRLVCKQCKTEVEFLLGAYEESVWFCSENCLENWYIQHDIANG